MEQGGRLRGSAGWALFLLTGISICGFIDRIILQVLVEPIKGEFHLSDFQIGMVSGLAFAALNVLLGIYVARIAERKRRLPLVWVGTILWSIATSLCGAATSFMTLLLARVGVGVGEAVGLPATSSLVADYFPPEKRTTALSALNLAPPLGAFIGSAGGAMMAQVYGWRSAFFIAAVPGLIFALLLAVTVSEPARGRHDRLAGGGDDVPSLGAVLARIWRRRALTHMLAGATVASVAGFAVNAFLAAFLLRRFGFSVGQAGVIAGLIASVPASISVFGAGWLADRVGRTRPAAYGLIPGIALLITCPLYALAVTRSTPGPAIALLAVTALVQYCYLAPTAGTLQNMMHPRMRASASAIAAMIYALMGGALGPMLIGKMSDVLAPDATPAGGAIGLAYAMAAMTVFYAWGALHYLWSSRYLARELALPID